MLLFHSTFDVAEAGPVGCVQLCRLWTHWSRRTDRDLL